MSVRRILGLLFVVLGSVIELFGVMMVVSAHRFDLAQPMVVAVGGVLVLAGVLLLKSAGSAPPDGESTQTDPAAVQTNQTVSPASAVFALLAVIAVETD